MSIRYAVYAGPEATDPLWAFGSEVLGFDAISGLSVTPPNFAGIKPEDWAALTAEARRYGFHATLKAPFRLKDGARETDLFEAVQAYCAKGRKLPSFDLKLTEISNFIALVPRFNKGSGQAQDLRAAVGEIVRTFDVFRAPFTQAELLKRLAAPLTKRQLTQLEAFGYPYIFEDFRFHLTLTGAISDADCRKVIIRNLEQHLLTLVQTPAFTLDALCIYRQDNADTAFRLIHRFHLTGLA